jgi:hypothetical protein
LPLILSAKDEVVLKYAKFEMIIDALNETFKFLKDNEGNTYLKDALETFQVDNQENLVNVLERIKDTYNENLEELKKEIILGLKDKPELKSRLDIRSTLRSSRYEGQHRMF